jgi:hypothetical protein
VITHCDRSRWTPDNQEYQHILLRVELTGGEEYAINLSGARHGYYEPITPWKVYQDTRVANIILNSDLSAGIWGAKKAILLQASVLEKEKVYGDLQRLNYMVSTKLVAAMKQWEEAEEMTIREMLLLPQQDFEEKRQELVGYAGKQVQFYLKQLLER